MQMNLELNRGFTLAEVLITLTVIGVLTAMTIPTLMNKINDAELRTVFKKMYSTTSQAMLSAASDNGGSIEGQFNNNDTFKKLFMNYLIPIRDCSYGDSSCWTCDGVRKDDYFLNKKSVKNTVGAWYNDRPGIVLKDGSLMQFTLISETCQGTDAGLIAPYAGTVCGAIYTDVNGCKAPNTWGKDIFIIYIQKNRIFPLGPSYNDNSDFVCTSDPSLSYAGLLCAGEVIDNKKY